MKQCLPVLRDGRAFVEEQQRVLAACIAKDSDTILRNQKDQRTPGVARHCDRAHGHAAKVKVIPLIQRQVGAGMGGEEIFLCHTCRHTTGTVLHIPYAAFPGAVPFFQLPIPLIQIHRAELPCAPGMVQVAMGQEHNIRFIGQHIHVAF